MQLLFLCKAVSHEQRAVVTAPLNIFIGEADTLMWALLPEKQSFSPEGDGGGQRPGI